MVTTLGGTVALFGVAFSGVLDARMVPQTSFDFETADADGDGLADDHVLTHVSGDRIDGEHVEVVTECAAAGTAPSTISGGVSWTAASDCSPGDATTLVWRGPDGESSVILARTG